MGRLITTYETFEKPGLVVLQKMSRNLIFKGSLVVIFNGYLYSADHTKPALGFAGVAVETVDNSRGDKGSKSCLVSKAGSFVFKADFDVSQADVGKQVYAVSDWEVTIHPEEVEYLHLIGTIQNVESTSTGVPGVRVKIDRWVI